jgi:hypothetical protein
MCAWLLRVAACAFGFGQLARNCPGEGVVYVDWTTHDGKHQNIRIRDLALSLFSFFCYIESYETSSEKSQLFNDRTEHSIYSHLNIRPDIRFFGSRLQSYVAVKVWQ